MRPALVLAMLALFVAGCGSTAASGRASTPLATGTSAPTPVKTAATDVTTDRTPCAPIAAGVATKTATMALASGATVTMALRLDKAPKTVATFTTKSNGGFYNGLTFHRVVPNFVVQGGDPLGNGTGGGNQATELSDLPFCLGSLGIARAGDIRVSNDSQFFICVGACRFLDGQYTNFGQVTSGMDAVTAIKVGDKIKSISVQ